MVSLVLSVDAAGHVHANLSGPPQYLVFDTETDGGSPKQRCIELAFIVFDASFRELHRYCQYWRLPPGRRISWHSYNVHKITDATVASRGVDPRGGLETFLAWVDRVLGNGGRIIAHNAAFDAKIINDALLMHDVPRHFSKEMCMCTMRASAPHAGCVTESGRRRAPKNAELYTILHGSSAEDWATLHTALDDVRVTKCNFQGGLARGWWW